MGEIVNLRRVKRARARDAAAKEAAENRARHGVSKAAKEAAVKQDALVRKRLEGAVLEAAINAVNGKIEDKNAFMAARRATNVDTARGPVKFDQYGHVVGNVYLRKVTRKDGRLVNSVIKTYPDVSQFWTYDPKAFLANPVYSRDYPPGKNLE